MEKRMINIKTNSKHLVGIKTRFNDEAYEGIVFYQCADFVAISALRELQFDGVIVFHRKAIRETLRSSFQKCREKVIQYNKMIGRAQMPAWVKKCKDIQQLFIELKSRRVWPCVEVSYQEKNKLYIGEINDIQSDAVSMHSYDAEGKWAKVKTIIPFSRVYKIEWGDGYTMLFNAYMRGQKNKAPIKKIAS